MTEPEARTEFALLGDLIRHALGVASASNDGSPYVHTLAPPAIEQDDEEEPA